MKKLLLSLMAVLCACVASYADTWSRCTNVADLQDGGTFIIGYEATANSGEIIPMKISGGTATSTAAGYMAAGASAINMATVTETDGYEVEIEASTVVTGAVCIKVGDYYLGNTDTKNNCKLFAEQSATTAFTLSVGTNDVFTFKIAANSSYTTLQYNASSPRFAVYGGAQKNLVVYAKGSGEGDPVAVTGVTLTDGAGNALSSYTAITVSETMQVKAVVTPSDATNKKVVWEVMQQSEVISFENGTVKALAPGQAALVATTEDGEFQAATIFQVSAPEDGTIADFIAAEGKTCYLTGVVSAITNTTYGNFTLTDESGSIVVYGTLNADGEAKKFEELGISEGDKIKVLASEYKLFTPKEGDPYSEAVNVIFVENLGPVTPPAEYTFEITDNGTSFTVTPSDENVKYYVDVIDAGYDVETVTNYFDGTFEEMGSGLEYFQGTSTQSYEDDWYYEVGDQVEIWVCAVSADYKRISDVFCKAATVTSDPTAIQTIKTSNGKTIRINLAGQKVNAAAKGIVIENAKKLLVK